MTNMLWRLAGNDIGFATDGRGQMSDSAVNSGRTEAAYALSLSGSSFLSYDLSGNVAAYRNGASEE